MSDIMLRASGISKSFVLHLQGGVQLDVLKDAAINVKAGECVALSGPSGAGKSTLLRALYGNYLVDQGEILVRHENVMIDLAKAQADTVIAIRRKTLGYVSQFLRAIPRVSALDIVAARALERGMDDVTAKHVAHEILERLGISSRLQKLPPATFSGGEQQRINLARSFVCHWPILLLDEPTASLDAANRDIVIGMIRQAKLQGSAVIGIFHDIVLRDAIADRVLNFDVNRDSIEEMV